MLLETGIKISGTDISPLIMLKGVKWSRRDVEGNNGGLTLDGSTARDVLASKVALEISCIHLELPQLRNLQKLLLPSSFDVVYDDPLFGEVTKIMCCKEGKATTHTIRQGRELWEGVVFKLEEI